MSYVWVYICTHIHQLETKPLINGPFIRSKPSQHICIHKNICMNIVMFHGQIKLHRTFPEWLPVLFSVKRTKCSVKYSPSLMTTKYLVTTWRMEKAGSWSHCVLTFRKAMSTILLWIENISQIIISNGFCYFLRHVSMARALSWMPTASHLTNIKLYLNYTWYLKILKYVTYLSHNNQSW
jgi:hypothetical protein